MQRPRSVVPGIVFPALPGPEAARLLAVQFQLERSQWWSADEMLEHQLAQAKLLLDHALETVPYFRELFAADGVRIPAELDIESFRRLPISTRPMVRDAGDRLKSERIPPQHLKTYPVVTSGSTGQPVRVLGTAIVAFMWQVCALRDHLWHARDFSRKQGAIRYFENQRGAAPAGLRSPDWGNVIRPIYDSAPAVALNIASPLAEQVAWLQRERPEYLLSYPSNLDALARRCLEQGIAMRFVEVRTIGENLRPEQRALYKRVWGCEVTDVYTCEETGYLALECPEHGRYHVQSENVLLEVVDDDGNACGPGRPGRVLITSLHNFATPLIRYELGDYASLGEPCACGRGLPVIAELHGRKRNRLIYPDGRSEFPYFGEYDQLYRETGVAMKGFQVIQRSLEDIEVRLAVDRELTADETRKVSGIIQRNLGHPFRIAITYWEEIPRGGRGKFEEFVSEVER